MEVKVVGNIKFRGKILPIYRSMLEPLFKVTDLINALEDSEGVVWESVKECRRGEQLIIDNGKNQVVYLTEVGIYNVLARIPTTGARAWKFMVHEEFSDIIDEKKRKDFARKEAERKKAEREAKEEEKRRLRESKKNMKNTKRKENAL